MRSVDQVIDMTGSPCIRTMFWSQLFQQPIAKCCQKRYVFVADVVWLLFRASGDA
jgi:hypothetical protein